MSCNNQYRTGPIDIHRTRNNTQNGAMQSKLPRLTCRINWERLIYLEYLLNTTRTLREIMKIVEYSKCATNQDTSSPMIEHNRLKTKLLVIKKIRSATTYPKNPHVGNQCQLHQRPTSISPPIRSIYEHQDKLVNLQTCRLGYTI